MHHAMIESAEEKRIARRVRFDGFVHPHAAATERGATFIELRGFDEPEIRIGDAGGGEIAFEFVLVEELALRRVIAAEHDAVVPATKIADDFQIRAARCDAGAVRGGECFRKLPEHAVHRHQHLVADLTDARPLRVPAMCAVVAMRCLRQSIRMPLAVIETHEDERAMIPADGPQRVVGF